MKKYLLLLPVVFVFFLAPKAHAAISFVQIASTTTATGVNCALPAITVTAGDLLVVGWGSVLPQTTTTISDTKGNTWALAKQASSTSEIYQIYYAMNAAAGSDTITVTHSAATQRDCIVSEYSGVATSSALDVTAGVATTTASTTYNSGSATTNYGNELFIGVAGAPNATEATITPGTGYVKRSATSRMVFQDATSSLGTSAGISVAATGTMGTSAAWISLLATFRSNSLPDATAVSTTTGNDGAKSGDTITITGSNFGTVSAGNRATCNGGGGTGCIQFVAGGNDTVADQSISSWTDTSIVFTVSSTLLSNGGVNALQVTAASLTDTTPLTFYIYPRIVSVGSLGAANTARIYNAADADGLIMLSGDHFGTTTGTSTILGSLATLYNMATTPCTVAGFASTSACFEVPQSIASNTYSGTIVLTRASDSKQATSSLSILPRIIAVNPTSTYVGQVVQITGDHFCQTGTCPVTPNRSSTTNNVLFGNTTSSDSDFLDLTGGGGTCNGSNPAWKDSEICVKVPAAAGVGSASTTLTSNGNLSNTISFTVTGTPSPGTPGTPTYTSINSSTLTVNWSSSTNTNYYKIERATSSQVFAQITTTTATSTVDSGLSANTNYFYRVRGNGVGGDGSYSASSSVITAPDIPGTPSYSSVGTTTLTVSWTAPTGGTSFYLIQRATSSQVFAQIATTTATTLNDTGLAGGTAYYYREQGVNAASTTGQFSASSTVTTLTFNSPPNNPSEDSPANGIQDSPTTPTFLMTATDPESNPLEYKVTIYSNVGCSTVVQTNDETATQTGWGGQNTSSSAEYTSGTQGSFTANVPLSQNTTYYWKASAIDPEGSNTWTNSATCNSFTTTFGNWTTDSGSWAIVSNQLVVTPTSNSSVQVHVTGKTQTNGIIDFHGESTFVGLHAEAVAGVMRGDTGANRYLIPTEDFSGQNVIGSTLTGSYHKLTFTAATINVNTFYNFRGSLSGSTFNGWINGGSVANTTDSHVSSAGLFGLEASSTSGGGTITVDDFAFYSSTVITLNNLPSGGSWSVLNHSGTVIACQTGSTWDLSTYSGQVPIDYDNGGGQIAVWTGNSGCTGGATVTYPSASLATDIFGGDTYSYAITSGITIVGGGAGTATSSISVNTAGQVSY